MRIYDLFISHSWAHSAQYKNLLCMLERNGDFRYRNLSVPQTAPLSANSDSELADALYHRMQPCAIVLVLAGVYADYSTWINKEIYIAKNAWASPKPVLAIAPQKSVSQTVKNSADKIVGWNASNIVSAIRQLV